MPVVDTPVHEKVREKEGAVYGCWNKPRNSDPYFVMEREYSSKGWYEMKDKWIENTMSIECRYDMSLKDPKCEGCEWRGSGEKYDAQVRANGT